LPVERPRSLSVDFLDQIGKPSLAGTNTSIV